MTAHSLAFTHSFLRSIADYIVVGSGTILTDDPRLVEHKGFEVEGETGGEKESDPVKESTETRYIAVLVLIQ